jgi:hypothetical protein
MLRRMVVVLAAVFLVPTMLSGAAAGGGSTFDFEDYYVAGERAVGETAFWISGKDRHLLNRTFYAYLIPGQQGIDPPRIPAGAVPLGQVTLGGLARVSFTVPDVAPGGYSVEICDRPCRHSFVGDLIGGWFTVVGSEEEARLRPVIDRLKDRLDRTRWDAIHKARKNQKRFMELGRSSSTSRRASTRPARSSAPGWSHWSGAPRPSPAAGRSTAPGGPLPSWPSRPLRSSRRVGAGCLVPKPRPFPISRRLRSRRPPPEWTTSGGRSRPPSSRTTARRSGRTDHGRGWLTACPLKSSARRRAARSAGGTGTPRTPRAAGWFPRSTRPGPSRTAGGAGTGRPTGQG